MQKFIRVTLSLDQKTKDLLDNFSDLTNTKKYQLIISVILYLSKHPKLFTTIYAEDKFHKKGEN